MSVHYRIDYFELPADDLGAAKALYSAAFDWHFSDYGPGYAGFVYPGAEREAGGISGDLAYSECAGETYSDDLESSQEKVRAAVGRIIKPIFSFPGGRRFHFADPSGNELAVWSDK